VTEGPVGADGTSGYWVTEQNFIETKKMYVTQVYKYLAPKFEFLNVPMSPYISIQFQMLKLAFRVNMY
jgi:hypothetical protein